jgi:hypothetical protein
MDMHEFDLINLKDALESEDDDEHADNELGSRGILIHNVISECARSPKNLIMLPKL